MKLNYRICIYVKSVYFIRCEYNANSLDVRSSDSEHKILECDADILTFVKLRHAMPKNSSEDYY